MKKFISTVLAVAIVFSTFFTTALFTYAVNKPTPYLSTTENLIGWPYRGIESNDTGECWYSFDTQTKVLTISYPFARGTPRMPDYTLQNGVYVVGVSRSCFAHCNDIKAINIVHNYENGELSAYYTNIGDAMFMADINVESVSIPYGIQRIGFRSFAFCYGLTDVTLPLSVMTIGDEAFYWCCEMKTITIPGAVQSIGKSAFGQCRELQKVYYGGTVADWYNIDISKEGNSNLTNAMILCSNGTINCPYHQVNVVSETPATCTTEGTRISRCDVCGFEKIDTIPKTAHTIVIDNEVAATCTTEGKTYGSHCSYCGTVIQMQETTAALGHSYSGKVTPPSCTAQGYTTYTCSRCSDSYTSEYTNAIGHNFSPDGKYCLNGCGTENPDYAEEKIRYIIPSLVNINAIVTIKSDENEYSVTSDNGVFELDNVKGNAYRIYAKQKNSLTVYIGEYDTGSGMVTNNDTIVMPLGDVNGDDVIDIADISRLLSTANYGRTNTNVDLTGDGLISIDDVTVILQESNYGKTSVNVV